MELGVVPGRGLSPFFIIFINDFVRFSPKLIFLYADDSTLYFSSSKMQSPYVTVNIELQKFIKWLHSIKVTFNIGKSN